MIGKCSSATAEIVIDLLIKPLKRGNAEIEAVPIIQHSAVIGMVLYRPPRSLPMIHDLKAKYAQLAPGGARCVFLRGEGRALCAGGDVAEVREGVLTGSK